MKVAFGSDTAASYSASALAYIVSDGIDLALNVVALILLARITAQYERNFSDPMAIPAVAYS